MVILKKDIVKPKKQILHGHTTIELKDVRTGKRERIEHDNTFTGALENYLKSNGTWRTSPWENSDWRSVSAYQRLLGGIYLFRYEISDNQGVYPHFMPSSNYMVGNGSFGVGNGSAVTEMGTYNSDESYFTDTALSFVYDWTTGQANDTFQCVCLGSDIGGYIGYGNENSNVSHPTIKNMLENQNNNPQKMNAIKDYDSFHGANTFSEASVTLYRQGDVYTDNVNLFVSNAEQIVINIPTDHLSASETKHLKFVDENKIAVIQSTLSPNQFVKLGIYDLKNQTWKWHQAKVGNSHPGYSVSALPSVITENGIFFSRGVNNFFTRFDENEDVDSQVTLTALDYGMSQFAPDLWMGNGYIYNARGAGKLVRCNGIMQLGGTNPIGFVPTKNDTLTLADYDNQGNNGLNRFHNPMYLATVNNLESPITKTSNNAMKITYTITKEDEE